MIENTTKGFDSVPKELDYSGEHKIVVERKKKQDFRLIIAFIYGSMICTVIILLIAFVCFIFSLFLVTDLSRAQAQTKEIIDYCLLTTTQESDPKCKGFAYTGDGSISDWRYRWETDDWIEENYPFAVSNLVFGILGIVFSSVAAGLTIFCFCFFYGVGYLIFYQVVNLGKRGVQCSDYNLSSIQEYINQIKTNNIIIGGELLATAYHYVGTTKHRHRKYTQREIIPLEYKCIDSSQINVDSLELVENSKFHWIHHKSILC